MTRFLYGTIFVLFFIILETYGYCDQLECDDNCFYKYRFPWAAFGSLHGLCNNTTGFCKCFINEICVNCFFNFNQGLKSEH